MHPLGSPQWQQYIFYAAMLVLLWQLWRGYRLGVVRALMRLVALVCAWLGSSMAAGATGTCVAIFSKVPPLLAPAIAGIFVGLAIYIVISFLSGLLFKRTEHHAGLVKWGFGFGGALFGVIYGFLFLFSGITLIRGLGALGEMRVIKAHCEGIPVASEKQALFFIKLKQSLELGEVGKSLKHADPLPTECYDDMVKISQIAASPQAIQRLLKYPSIIEFVQNPKILTFIQDPEVQRALQKKNILPLLQNKNFLELTQDPQILAQLKKINFTEALDAALNPLNSEIKIQSGKLRRRVSPLSPAPLSQSKKSPSPILNELQTAP